MTDWSQVELSVLLTVPALCSFLVRQVATAHQAGSAHSPGTLHCQLLLRIPRHSGSTAVYGLHSCSPGQQSYYGTPGGSPGQQSYYGTPGSHSQDMTWTTHE